MSFTESRLTRSLKESYTKMASTIEVQQALRKIPQKSISTTETGAVQFLPFHVPDIGDDEIQSVVETLRSGWLTTGPKVRQFEADFANFVGCQHAVAVNSGTAALHLALDAVGIKDGDEVIVPTMTFTATAEVVLYFKAMPVLVDCETDTLNIDPDQIERKITSKTRAIIPVHIAGQSCDMDRILQIARRYNLRVIEDAAHALPALFRGKMVGTIGDITCFSFYATKTITTGEGGMATTGSPEWAERMRIMSLHGISKDAWKRYSNEGSWYYEVHYPWLQVQFDGHCCRYRDRAVKKVRAILAMRGGVSLPDMMKRLRTCRKSKGRSASSDSAARLAPLRNSVETGAASHRQECSLLKH